MKERRSFILTYHSLDDMGSVISVAPRMFSEHMQMLAESGRPVVPLSDIPHRRGAVAITFDDGFQSFYDHALPVLQRYGFPATVFVVSGYCGRNNDWPTQTAGVPRWPLMSWSQVCEISRDTTISIGAHTVTHPRLPTLDAQAVDQELRNCRDEIEDRIGRAVTEFAYPYGAANELVYKTAARHFRSACGTRLGYLGPGDDPLDLPRLDCYYLRSSQWFARAGDKTGELYISARSQLRELRKLIAR